VFNGGPLSTSLLTITTTDDDARFNGPVELRSDVRITTGLPGAGDIEFTVASPINSQAGAGERNELTLETGAGDIRLLADVGAADRLGDVLVTQAMNVLVDKTLSSRTLTQNNGTGTTTFNAAVTIDGAQSIVTTNPPPDGITLRNDAIVVNAAMVATNDARIVLNADDVEITALGSLNNSADGIVTIRNKTAGREINLGTETVGSLSLTDDELDRITTGTLRIGRRAGDTDGLPGNTGVASGDITITDTIDPALTSVLHLRTGGDIVAGPLGLIVETRLGLESDGTVDLPNGNNVVVLAARVYGAGETFEFTDINDLSIDRIDTFPGTNESLIGLTTSGGDVKLTIGNNLNIDDDLTAGLADVTLIVGNLGTQSAGNQIFADGLQLLGAGAYELQDPGNDVNTIAGVTGGQIRYTDLNDLSVGIVSSSLHPSTSGITAPGVLVSLTSVTGGITDGNAGATNITSGSTALRAATGIGSADALETKVSSLSARNTTAGHIRIHNTVGGTLDLTAVDGFDGVRNDAPLGDIEITNDGAMNVQRTVQSLAGGHIDLTTTAGNLTVNRPVLALGGNGSIGLFAAADLVLNDTGIFHDIEVEGTGDVLGIAGGDVIIAGTEAIPTFIVKSETGKVSRVPILIQNVQTPQVGADGVATLIFDVGVTTERNFTVVIDWQDGTIETFTLPTGATTYTFTHQYLPDNLPDPNNPANPIPITFEVQFDPLIRFFSLGGGTDLNRETIVSLADVPGEGIGGFFFILPTVTPQAPLPRPSTVTFVLTNNTTTIIITQTTDVRTSEAETVSLDDRLILLRVLYPDGSTEDFPFANGRTLDDILRDLPKIFEGLIDGHYQIIIQDGDIERIAFDVRVVRGEPTDPASEADEGSQEKPPTPASEAPQEIKEEIDEQVQEEAVEEGSLPDGANADDGAADVAPVAGAGLEGLPVGPLDWSAEAVEADSSFGRPLLAGGLLAGGLAAAATRGRWEDRVDQTLRRIGKKSLGKAARLCKQFSRS
jgi:hypothetical protein